LISELVSDSNLINFELVIPDRIDFSDNVQVSCLPKVSIIIHLAAKTFIPDSFEKPHLYYQNNLLSTINVLEKARRDKAKVIFLSTYIYGAPKYLPVDENHPAQPANPYTQSKVLCEQLCEAYVRDFSIDVVVLRPFNIYGPGQSSHFFIPTIISQIDNDIINLQDSEPKRDYIFIKDLIDVIIICIKNKMNGLEVFNVGSGISYSVKEVVSKIVELSESKAEINYSGIKRKGEVVDCVASIEKLFKRFGWKPNTMIDEGLGQILNLIKG
jgi:UDP-glucose 4-epimerase